jgi:hypothetical protein
MGALLGFAPFIGFAVIENLFGAVSGLAAGAAISIALLVFDLLKGQRDVNILEAGSAVMFTGLACVAFAGGGDAWSLWRVRLWVDGGLLLIVLASIVAGRPFTLHHARQRVSAEVAGSARFLHTNNVLSGAWALAFVVLAATDLLMVMRPETPVRLAVWSTLGALSAAAWPARTRASCDDFGEPGHGLRDVPRPGARHRETGVSVRLSGRRDVPDSLRAGGRLAWPELQGSLQPDREHRMRVHAQGHGVHHTEFGHALFVPVDGPAR